MNIENNPPAPSPKISLLGKNVNTKPNKFPSHKEEIQSLNMPVDLNKLKRWEYDELLTEARKSILEDKSLLEKIFQAVVAKTQSGAVIKFTEVENILVEKCINLTESDIDNVVRQLGRKFLDYIRQNNKMSEIFGQAREDLITGRFNIDERGIKSVVAFVRERTKLLMSMPAQNFVIGFNNNLDARRKIDLIEIIFGESELDIDQLNFIQIKSSSPTKEEVEDITEAHKIFANRDILSLNDIETSQLPGKRIHIHSVNSIVTTGSRVVNQQNVYDSKQDIKGDLAAIM